jgi:TonB family protein
MEYSVGSVKADSLNCSDSQLANVQSYGLSVQAAIGPKVLDGGGLEGRVLIAFSLGVDGTLVGVRIAQSSGHQRLDSQAAQLVGRASFPLPPAQLSARSARIFRPSPSNDDRLYGQRLIHNTYLQPWSAA